MEYLGALRTLGEVTCISDDGFRSTSGVGESDTLLLETQLSLVVAGDFPSAGIGLRGERQSFCSRFGNHRDIGDPEEPIAWHGLGIERRYEECRRGIRDLRAY